MWSVEFDPSKRQLTLRVTGVVTVPKMRALLRAHSQALLASNSTSFVVLADVRGVVFEDAEAQSLWADIQRAASAVPGFRGRATLASSGDLGLQRRSTEHAANECFTTDEVEARAHLRGLIDRA